MEIVKCDFNITEHCDVIIKLMRDYMTDEMGGVPAHSDQKNKEMIEGLKNHPTVISLLAEYDGKYVGLTNSFINFGTFAAKKFLNIHDVIVNKNYRGKGIGELLIRRNIELANEMGFYKVTLEVRNDNKTAQNLYKKTGFGDCKPPMLYWARVL